MSIAITGLFFAALPSLALGQPTISVSPSGGGTWDPPTFNSTTGKWNIELQRSTTSSIVTFTVRASDTEGIHFLFVDLNGAGNHTFLDVLPKSGSLGVESVDAIDEINDNGFVFTVSNVVTTGHLGNNLSVSDNAITADAVGALNIGGNVLRPILAETNNVGSVTVGGSLQASITSTNGSIGSVIVTGAIGPSAIVNIYAKGGISRVDAASINARIRGRQNGGDGIVHRVATTSGDFDGELDTRIFAPLSGVTSGVFVAGDMNATVTAGNDLRTPFEVAGDLNGAVTIRDVWIGTLGEPDGSFDIGGDVNADITIRDIQAGAGGTGRIDIAGNLAADIIVTGMADGVIDIDGNFTSGTIDLGGSLDGTISIGGSITGGTIDVGEDINGAITVGNDVEASGTILCQGDINADITITDDLAGLINVGGSLLSGKTIAAQALALAGTPGQIIINSLAPTSGPGTWSGSVTVNGTTITGTPYYTTTGLGGAVGLARFNLHDEDCFPANGDLLYPNDGLITLRFYGPVDCASGFPFNITWCPNPSPSCDPTYENEHWVVYSGQGSRTIYLQYVDDEQEPTEVPTGRYYTIFPVLTGSNALLCDDLLSTSDVPAADFAYEFNTDY